VRIKLLLLLFQTSSFFLIAHGQQSDSSQTGIQLGRRVFEQRCAVCHTRTTLTARKPLGPILSKELLESSGDFARNTILRGRAGMPGFQYGLSDNEVDAILEYLNTGPTLVETGDSVKTAGNDTNKTKEEEKPRDSFLLIGSVKSSAGEKMEGVVISAKAEGQPITTSVFTDKNGNYYFPSMPAGKYRTWAQTQAYEIAKGEVDLTMSRRKDFVLQPMNDFFLQLSGDQVLSALPADTPNDRRMKLMFQHDCMGCHTINYVLQNRFDEAGWTAIIDVMKRETGIGTPGPIDEAPLPILQAQEKELAAYLAKMRGPGPSPMKVEAQTRPTGEAARVVFTEYDVPVDWSWDKEVMGGVLSNNGCDWSLGAPSSMNGGRGVHDAQADMSGDIWFSFNAVSKDRTIGRIDANTGQVKSFGLPGAPGLASMGHSIVMDHNGILWFNVNPRGPHFQAPEKLGGVDPKTEKIEVFTPPKGIDPPGGAVTMDVDAKGYVWVSSRFGVLRFDPKTHQFIEFKSNTKVFEGVGTSYGVAGDREGNGWWAQFYSGLDTVEKGDLATGKTMDVKLSPVPGVMDLFTQEDLKMYRMAGSDQEAAIPWLQGPRRMGADHDGDVVWVGDYWSGNLARIDIHTLKYTFVSPPNPNLAAYSATVDESHNVWVTFMNGDQVGKYDPKTLSWTMYRLPSLGTDVRWVSLHEKPDGTMQVILPYFASSRVARMTFRTEAELQALEAKAHQELRAQGR
jgi:streptogramin lyase/cytochrome c5